MMKNTIAIIALLFFGTTAFGQSKKKMLNHQLHVQLIAAEHTYDSIMSVHEVNLRDIKYARDRVDYVENTLADEKRRESMARNEITRKHALLSDLGFNANSIVSLNAIDTLMSPGKSLNFEPKSDQTIKYTIYQVEEMQDISEMKIKEQNEILKLRVADMTSANDRNKKVLAAERTTISNLTAMKEGFEQILKSYTAFNKNLYNKSRELEAKYIEENQKKEEEERIKEEKAIAAANKKKKKKNGKVQFVPPVIIDRPYEETYDVEGVEMNVSSDRWGGDFAEPAPEPPVEEIKKQTPDIFDIVEEPAEFPGGTEAMKKYVKDNLKIPAVAVDMGINSKCYLKFVVSEAGNISNVKVVRGIADCRECDNEAVRVIKAMPNWTPGKNEGKAVNSWFTLPIQFKAD